MKLQPTSGAPALGARLCEHSGQSGVLFSVWAPEATGIEVCFFDAPSRTETARLALMPGSGGLWSAFAPGLKAGQCYGLRASGPWNPAAGQRFNPARLLLDPWALALVGDTTRLAIETGHVCTEPLQAQTLAWDQHQPDPQDNAAHMPLSVVIDAAAELAAGAAIAPRPLHAADQLFIYEAHVKALTQCHPDLPEAQRGTYAGLAHPALLQHFKTLGVTTLCLLPVHAHISERHLLARGLSNHWGYNTLNAFVPDAGYSASRSDPGSVGDAAAQRAEFRQMVNALHGAGIEVVLDVVFNHTAESDLDGPTLSWRGLGQNAWYAMGPHGVPHNFSGCGNSLNFSQPRVLQWVMDSLRWWVMAYGVDGFRFDLAASLGRDAALGFGFNAHAALLSAMAQDPVLRDVRLIAEPWDIGPGGYQLGAFGAPWLEWNDQFRDTVRAFWLGHSTDRARLAASACGSSTQFAHDGRRPAASVNMVCAHDGFNLADLTAFENKHNLANGEDNRDGHGHNLSANGGAEGHSDDPAVLARRGAWRRALLATLFCAQGTPQLLAGDEIAHSQHGNNNAYCQDNALTWIDWHGADKALCHFVAGLSALRRRHPGLRHGPWFTGRPQQPGNEPDIAWMDFNGLALSAAAWHDGAQRGLVAQITVGEGTGPAQERLLLVWSAEDGERRLTLPPGPWRRELDSASAWVAKPGEAGWTDNGEAVLNGPGVCVLVQGLHGLAPASNLHP